MVQTQDELFQGIRQYNTNERKIEYIENEIKKGMKTELKITALVLMADIYKNKKWYNSAAKHYCSAADLAPTFREKIDLYFKTAVMFLQIDDYFSADDNFRKVLVLASSEQKPKIQEKMNELYIERAEKYYNEKYYTKAIKTFSKVLSLKLPREKMLQVYDKLSELYEKIGKPREASQIKVQKENFLETDQKKTES